MNALASRKKLLVAESELNRAQLFREWQELAGEANALTKPARILDFIVSTAARLISNTAAFWQKKSARATEKTSWLPTILKGAQLAGALWAEFGPARRRRN
jgi:hypothetical protein